MNIKVFNIRLAKEFCQQDQDAVNQFLNSVEVKLTSTNFVTSGTKDFWSVAIFFTPKSSKKEKSETKLLNDDLSQDEQRIFSALRQWRNDLSQKLNWPPFRICHNSHLIAVAKANPQTLEELEQISVFGKSRTGKYGEDIIAVLNAL